MDREQRVRAICGVFRTDGVVVDRERLRAMGEAAPVPRPGPVRCWSQGGIGFAWLGGPEHLPQQDEIVLVADGRLHAHAPMDEPRTPWSRTARGPSDLESMRRAYLRGGALTLGRLVGDYALALYDGRRERLVLARDPFGARTLCVFRRDGLVVFGTWIHSILAHPDVPRRIDEARVADYFVDYLESLDKTSTFYEGIERHPPAHVLTVQRDGATLQRAWRLEIPGRAPRWDPKEQVATVRGFLEEAVANRLDAVPTAAVMLSGGVDSIAVACLAREHHRAGRRGAVPTLSGVLSDPDVCTEGPSARAVVEAGGFDPTWIHPESMSRYGEAIRHVVDSTEDLFDVTMLEIRVAVVAEAARQGGPALLDGVDGNLVFSHHAEALAFLLRRGRLRTAWRVAGGLSRHYELSRRNLLWSYGLRPLRPEVLARFRQSLRTSSPHLALLDGCMIAPELVRRADLPARLEQRFRRDPLVADALRHDPWAFHRHNLESALIPAALERYARAAGYQGLEISHPLLDPRVVQAALSLPFELKVHRGWPKFVLRKAIDGLAPADVVWRRRNANLSSEFWRATLEVSDDLLAAIERPGFRQIGQFADMEETGKALVRWRRDRCVVSGVRAFRVAVLGSWLERRA